MSESTRTLKEGEPGIYWVRQHGADDVFVRKWTGRRWELVDNQRVYWTDWSFWLIVSGPLLSESDFMQREDVKRWKEIEKAAKRVIPEACPPALNSNPAYADAWHLLWPAKTFTPPPKPELKLWKSSTGAVEWAVDRPPHDYALCDWHEIDSTGQPISAKEQSDVAT